MRRLLVAIILALSSVPALAQTAEQQVLFGNPSLSAEMVKNGGFDGGGGWFVGIGWAITSLATKTAGTSSQLVQSPVSIIPGQSYTTTFTISGYTAGAVNIRLENELVGGLVVAGTNRSANGTFTETLTAIPGNHVIGILGNATFAGSIDNVSVKLVGP